MCRKLNENLGLHRDEISYSGFLTCNTK